ncbi:MAG: universal stress protein, partial [Bacteroidota bacterium]
MKKNTNPVILVPVDFTELTEFATDHAIGIAKQLKATITLCHVINKDTKSMLKKQGLHLDSLFKLLQKNALEIKDKHGIETDYMTREGSIFSTIGQIAEESGAHILVMGTHGKIGVQHLIGSYALKVITSSPSPVIVVQKTRFHNEYKNIVLPIDYTSESKQKVKWAINIARELKSTVHIFAVNDP